MPSGVYPRKKKGRFRSEEESIELPKSNEEASKEIQSILASLPSDDKVELYREDSEDGKWAVLALVPVSQFSLDWVQKNCGGGAYMLMIRKPDGSGAVLARKFFTFDKSLARRAPPQPGEHSAMGTVGDGGLPPMMGLILQMQQASSDRMIEMMSASNQQMTTLLAAVLGKGNDIAGIVGAVASLTPKTDPIEAFARLTEITKAKERDPSSLTDKLEEWQMMRRVFGGIDGEESGGFWGKIINDFLPPTLSVLKTALENRQASPTLPAPAPVAGALPPGQPDPLSLIVQPPLSTQLRALVPQLVKRGLQGGDPESFASVIIEDIPVGLFPQIHKALAEDGIIDAIISAAPELEPVREYATHFLTAILEMTGDEEAPPVAQVADTVTKPKKGGKAR